MKSKILPILLILIPTLIATSCSDSPLTPVEEKPPLKAADFGLMEVTISGLGTGNMTASAHFLESKTAFNLSQPSGSVGPTDGTIQMESVSNGSFTYGTRGSGGVRYFFATFKVRNANADGEIYTNVRHNLTFLAVDTDQTYGITAISTLRLFDGTELTGAGAQAIAAGIFPTGAARLYFDGSVQPNFVDALQVYTESQIAAFTPPSSVNNIFPYGFITRSPNTTSFTRHLPGFPAPDQFDGRVTFAFKIPLQAQANQDPFEITAIFLPVDDSETHITQSLEEQNVKGNALLFERTNNLFTGYITTFPGNTYRGKNTILCTPVRVTGPAGSPATTLFPTPPTFVSLSPAPGIVIIDNLVFSATFSGTIPRADAVRFVVRGRQSGVHFIGDTYTGIGTTTISTPAVNFFPGEIIEVSITPGLGICDGTVYRYRAVAGGGFVVNFSVDGIYGAGHSSPIGMVEGDWDGDGDLDLAIVFGGSDDNISVKLNNGDGTFALSADYPAGDYPYGITAGDWDGDGDLDLVVTNVPFFGSGDIFVLKGNGDGTFAAPVTYAVGIKPIRIAAGDWNGDGDLDLAVSNNISDNISVLAGNGNGTFAAALTYPAGDDVGEIKAGDWNGDGILDLAAANFSSDNISVLLGNGDGTFATHVTYMVGDSPSGIVAGDLDADGDQDLAVVNSADNNISVLLGNGDGTYAADVTYAVGNKPFDITAGDWNSDGVLDLAVTNNDDDTISVLLNNGDGIFFGNLTYMVGGTTPAIITAGDFIGDSGLDLAVANYDSDNISILENQ